MILAGRDVGAFALLVGVDYTTLIEILTRCAPPGGISVPVASAMGVPWPWVEQMKMHGLPALLDRLGDSLHPSKHAALVASLRASGVPVIATTHSPDLVDCVTYDEVFVCAGDTVRCLAEHPEAAEWRTLLRTGEFWGTVGEAWVSK